MYYTYFVAYATPTGPGMANVERTAPIRNWADIQDVAEFIRHNQGHSQIAVTNYQLMSQPDTPADATATGLDQLTRLRDQLQRAEDNARVDQAGTRSAGAILDRLLAEVIQVRASLDVITGQ